MKRLLPLTLSVLALVVVACGSEAPSSGAQEQGVRGVVLLGPRCPIETEASPCPDEPLPGVTVRVLRDGEPIDSTATSDGSGRFELRLPPGDYTLEAIVPDGGPGMSAKPVDVTVSAGGFVDVVVPVDTGIR
jgi:Carboxypeptidase regulatory-like domain